jgi:hypothetical protein
MPSYAPFYAMIGLFFLLYILPLGVRPIMVPDESRYAEIPREMIASGDWTAPHLNGLRYFEKPVLGYWLNAGSIMLFGENAFAIRFPSAMSAGISAVILFLLVRRYAGGYSAGILAACMFRNRSRLTIAHQHLYMSEGIYYFEKVRAFQCLINYSIRHGNNPDISGAISHQPRHYDYQRNHNCISQ